MHDEGVDERIRGALSRHDGAGPGAAEADPVAAVRSRVVRRRRHRRGTAGMLALGALLTVGAVAVGSADSDPEDVRTAGVEEPAPETATTPTTLETPSPALPPPGEPGDCATQMIVVATGATWTLERGLGDGRPSFYDVSVDGEVVFGGCGSDQGAKAAGHMPWFSGRVGDDWLLFGEVPVGVSAVAVNGKVIDAVTHEGADLALVVATLSGSDLNVPEVTLEAVRSDGTRTPLAPAAINPGLYNGFVVVFPTD